MSKRVKTKQRHSGHIFQIKSTTTPTINPNQRYAYAKKNIKKTKTNVYKMILAVFIFFKMAEFLKVFTSEKNCMYNLWLIHQSSYH